MSASQPEKKIPNGVKFLFGGLAGMGATFFVQPLDLIKNRMQLSAVAKDGTREYRSSLHLFSTIVKTEGPLAVYNGLSAGLARQATYTTCRLGIYSWLFEQCSSTGKSPSFPMKLGLGMTAGAISSFIGTPTEVALVRMTADGRLPVDQRRNYKSVFDALARIIREEGFTSLWRGSTPTIVRAMVVNAAQLATYSQAKQAILDTKSVEDGIFCHFLASMISGLATTIASMPVDNVKTKIQNMRVIDGKPEYSGITDVVRRVITNDGVFALWRGFTPYFMRLGPHTVITFIILEKMNELYNEKVLKLDKHAGKSL